jgi:hypothetical protein
MAGLVGAVAVALSSGAKPWIDAASGAFHPPDIAQDVAAAHLFADRISPYGPVIREMHSHVTGLPLSATYPYFPHPPFSLLVSLYSAYVSFQTAALAWFAFSLALVFMLAALLAENVSDADRSGETNLPGRWVAAFFVLLLLWPPVLYNLEKGQWTLLLAVLIALGWRSLSRGRQREGGGLIGAAASVKVFPILLGGYLLLRARRGFLWFVIVGLLSTCIPLLWIGLDAFPAFIRESQRNLPNWETFPSVMYSLHGALARLLIGSQWARPAVHAPTLVRWIEVPATLGLLWLAARAALRAPARGRSAADRASFSAWCVLLPILNPQSMGHNGLLLALPLVLTACILFHDYRTWVKVAWAAGLVLVSIPRQTLWRPALAPVGPWEGIAVIALPMWGALLLFAVAIACGARRSTEVFPAQNQGKAPAVC